MPAFSSAEDFIASLPALACPICCEPFSEGHLPVSFDGCRHVFGAECLKAWVTSGQSAQKTCPTCRTVMFDVSQPGQFASAAVATNSPSTIPNEAPYQPVVSDSDYEYETDDDGACICEEVLAREEQRKSNVDRIRRQQREFIAEHDRRMEESRFIMQIASHDPARALAMHKQSVSPRVRQYIRQRKRDDAYDMLTAQVLFRGPAGNSLWEEFLKPCVQQIVNEVLEGVLRHAAYHSESGSTPR